MPDIIPGNSHISEGIPPSPIRTHKSPLKSGKGIRSLRSQARKSGKGIRSLRSQALKSGKGIRSLRSQVKVKKINFTTSTSTSTFTFT
jgi:hypothetical protein